MKELIRTILKEELRLKNNFIKHFVSEAKIKVNKNEFEKLFEDDTILAIKPLTHQASCKYGSGTKWCIAMRDNDKYWKNYTKKTSKFAGVKWYNVVSEVQEELERSWLDKLLGKPPKIVNKEVKEFVQKFPVGILYFVIVKKRITGYEWDNDLKYNKPIYERADPKDPMNKLALLYKPGRADFGDLSKFGKHDFYSYIRNKLDASHNNMSIFNALDQKVTLREVNKSLGRQFNVAFAFIEENFQKERDAINEILKNVLDKVYPLPGDEGSSEPTTWVHSDVGLQSVPTKKIRDKDGTFSWLSRDGKPYKGGAW